MKAQKFTVVLGPVRLALAVGDVNGNGVVDVSLTIRVVGLFELPPFVVDLDAKLAQDAIDGFQSLAKALTKGK